MIVKNARIVTFDEDEKIYENGYIKIDDGIITEIGDTKEIHDVNEQEVIDAEGKIVLPGFICTHTHIYSAFARGMILDGKSPENFFEILQNLWWRLDKKLTHEEIYYSALVTIIDCIRNGVTCLFDHHSGPNSVDGSLDVIERAYRELGMRGTLCYEVSDRDGKDTAIKGIKENSRFLLKVRQQEDDMVKALFGLHAAFTLSDATLEKAAEEGQSLDAGYHVHAAEGIYDYEYNAKKYGLGVVERLDRFGLVNSKSILAHCIHIKDSEKEILKKCSVVHNPESNMNNAVGYCDAIDLLRKGILVGLGSDGFSANPFRAMDICYVIHKHEKKDPRVMTPIDVIKIAIKNNGSIASRYFDNDVGIIKKGAKGDIIMLQYNSPTPVLKNNICGHIIFGMNSNLVTDSIINGKLIMKNRELVGIDENRLCVKSQEISKKLWERI